ncbi:MAG: hypothetical protein HQL27_02080 [Candidatus Omnitrophica bacterium]|nr:hypothetical protein [Candidatus Omnitrophota bacterium]
MKKTAFLIIILFAFAVGCSMYSIDSQELTGEYYPSKNTSDDVVYMETVTEPSAVIGYVVVNAERRQSLEDVIIKMKREAAILGADAITEITTDASGTWKKLPAQKLIGNAYVRANFKAKMVVFKE